MAGRHWKLGRGKWTVKEKGDPEGSEGGDRGQVGGGVRDGTGVPQLKPLPPPSQTLLRPGHLLLGFAGALVLERLSPDVQTSLHTEPGARGASACHPP